MIFFAMLPLPMHKFRLRPKVDVQFDDMNSLAYEAWASRVMARSCIHVLTSPRYHAVIISMKQVWCFIC